MKKILAIVLCAVMVFSFSGCSIIALRKSEAAENNASKVTNTATTKDIHEYIKANQKDYDKLAEDLKYIMKFEVEARGNSLVYKYTYQMDMGDVAELKETFDAQYDILKPQVKPDLTALKDAVPNAKSLFVEYYNVDGTLISSLEFKVN